MKSSKSTANKADSTVWMIAETLKLFIKPLKVGGELVILLIGTALPYYFASLFEGYLIQTLPKKATAYQAIHLDEAMDFGYILAAIATVIIFVGMCHLIKNTLDWHPYWPRFMQKWLEQHPLPNWLKQVRHVCWYIISTIITLILITIPYNLASDYESYVMHLNVTGQSKYTLSHLGKSVNFVYALAAAATIAIIMLFIQYLRQHHWQMLANKQLRDETKQK